ncbi:MAG TPA: TMEM165/GDT1 family protein [Myxococcales bacterium]|jgi:putative Ca2+/H+ antiporter (TMEM165/GDT1 family)|nr:TMEM165/GDT1 family protein [Myxococcales bacterium]
MDLKLMATAFATVFLAELGDKTQLATLTFAAESRSRWAVFLGAAGALVATSAIAVLLGEAVSRVVPVPWLKRAAGAAFIAIGAWTLLTSGPAR